MRWRAPIRSIGVAVFVAAAAAALTGAYDAEPPTCSDPPVLGVRTDPPVSLSIRADCREPSYLGVAMVVERTTVHGTLTPHSNSADTVSYVPAKGFAGEDSFTYHVTSANGRSNTVEQRITVDPAFNHEPWCRPTTLAVQAGRSRTVALDCFDPDGDPLALSVTTPPQHGTATVTNAHRSVTYAAGTGYAGPDTLSVRVEDGHGGSAEAPVEVTIVEGNLAPVCRDQLTVAASGKDRPVSVGGACSDPDGDPLTLTVTAQPAHGVVIPSAVGLWRIVMRRFVGEDRFTVVADDGAAQTPFTVHVRVVDSLDTAPECASFKTTAKAGTAISIQLQCFDRDLDVPSLRVFRPPARDAGTLEEIDQATQTVRFRADERFTGVARFSYGAEHAGGPSPPATVEIAVTDGAPALRIAGTARQRVGTVLAKGVAMVVVLDEPARLAVSARVDGRTARRLGLAGRAKAIRVGRAVRAAQAGRTTVRVPLNAKARRALRRARRATTLRLAVSAKDAAGNVGAHATSLTLKKKRKK